jgi:hypothetical protein
VEVGAARVCGESGRSQGFTVGTKTAAMAAWQHCASAREGRWPAFMAKLKVKGRSSCVPWQQAAVWVVAWPRYGGSSIGRARSAQPARVCATRGVPGVGEGGGAMQVGGVHGAGTDGPKPASA